MLARSAFLLFYLHGEITSVPPKVGDYRSETYGLALSSEIACVYSECALLYGFPCGISRYFCLKYFIMPRSGNRRAEELARASSH